jgi:hypothetical protein
MSRAGIHITGRIATTVGIAVIALGGLSAAALAATGNSVTVQGMSTLTVHQRQSLSLQGRAPAYCDLGLSSRRASLSITGPSGSSPVTFVLQQSASTPCDQDINLADTIQTPGRNGVYSVQMASHGQTATATLNVLVRPVKVHHVKVETSGTTATFTWRPNPESDVTGYRIVDVPDGTIAATPSAADDCSATKCKTQVNLGDDAAGTSESFAIRAVRCGLSCSDNVLGKRSATVQATFASSAPPSSPPAPTSPPSPAPGQGNGGNPGSNPIGTVPGASVPTASVPGGPTHSPGSHQGVVGSSPSPPPPKHSSPAVVANGQVMTSGSSRGVVRTAGHDIAVAFTYAPVWRAIAVAVLLSLIALHFRAWSERLDARRSSAGARRLSRPAPRDHRG